MNETWSDYNGTWEELNSAGKSLKWLAIFAGVLTFCGLILPFFLFSITLQSGFNPSPLFLLLIPAVIAWVIFGKKYKVFCNNYKTLVVNQAAKGMFDRYVYTPDLGFDRDEISDTGIMSMGNQYNSEDMVEGSYKGVTFRRADIYIAQHTSNGKSSHTTVYLRGSWLVFSYNKKFKADMQIVSKDFSYANQNLRGFFNRSATARERFETEDMEFNRMFTCTCQNDAEAFYLLTPHVIQMLKLLKTEFGHPYMVGFVHNKLHFAINSGENHMEPSMFSNMNYATEVELTRRELKTICNIIDSLAIDRDIFDAEEDW